MLSMTNKQKSVMKLMTLGLTISLISLYCSKFINIENVSIEYRLELMVRAIMVPLVFVVICIGKMASHRFNSKEDIDGKSDRLDTVEGLENQKVLQNTLEQGFIAVCAYVVFAIVSPANYLGLLIVAPVLFAIGRILFILNHKKGAVGRALGFTLTFYPTVLMIFIEIGLLFIGQ